MQRFPMKIAVELVFAKPCCLDASESIRPPPGLEPDDNSLTTGLESDDTACVPLTPTRPTRSRLGSDPMKIAVEQWVEQWNQTQGYDANIRSVPPFFMNKTMEDFEECKHMVIPFQGAQVPPARNRKLIPCQIDGHTGAAQTNGSSAAAPVQAPREIAYAVLSNIPSRTQRSAVWRAIEARGFAGEVIGFCCPTRKGGRNRILNLGCAYVELADQGVYERFAAALSGCQFDSHAGPRRLAQFHGHADKHPETETQKVVCVAFVYMDESDVDGVRWCYDEL